MDPIAERTFDFWDPATKQSSLMRVLVGKPEQGALGQDWTVSYEIHGPGLEEVHSHRSSGVDAMQAVILALQILPVWLERLGRHGRLTWLGGEAGDLGFAGLVPFAVPDDSSGGSGSCPVALEEREGEVDADPQP
jgi:hypothetical protein